MTEENRKERLARVAGTADHGFIKKASKVLGYSDIAVRKAIKDGFSKKMEKRILEIETGFKIVERIDELNCGQYAVALTEQARDEQRRGAEMKPGHHFYEVIVTRLVEPFCIARVRLDRGKLDGGKPVIDRKIVWPASKPDEEKVSKICEEIDERAMQWLCGVTSQAAEMAGLQRIAKEAEHDSLAGAQATARGLTPEASAEAVKVAEARASKTWDFVKTLKTAAEKDAFYAGVEHGEARTEAKFAMTADNLVSDVTDVARLYVARQFESLKLARAGSKQRHAE